MKPQGNWTSISAAKGSRSTFRSCSSATISYGEMAARLGMPKAVRAVANANGANAISIIAPCHRVIGSDGTLTGYGGGLDAKKYLLSLEQDPQSLILR